MLSKFRVTVFNAHPRLFTWLSRRCWAPQWTDLNLIPDTWIDKRSFVASLIKMAKNVNGAKVREMQMSYFTVQWSRSKQSEAYGIWHYVNFVRHLDLYRRSISEEVATRCCNRRYVIAWYGTMAVKYATWLALFSMHTIIVLHHFCNDVVYFISCRRNVIRCARTGMDLISYDSHPKEVLGVNLLEVIWGSGIQLAVWHYSWKCLP